MPFFSQIGFIQININIMYRNTYLEMYKTAYSHDSNLTHLLAHFTQIYNTLGCVLQDLEFQIGKNISQQPLSNQVQQIKQSFPYYNKSKQKIKEKEIIKIEESLTENIDKNNISKNKLNYQSNAIKKSSMSQPKREEDGSQSSDCNFMISRILQNKASKAKDILIPKIQIQPIEIPRENEVCRANSTQNFQSLFQAKKVQKMDIQRQPQRQNNRNSAPQPLPEESSNLNIDNTYEDFLDRFFNQNQSRKSR